jgi:uncharacterized protein (DUF1778 family)
MFKVCVSPEDKALLQEAAKRESLTLSTYIRSKAVAAAKAQLAKDRKGA